MVTKRIWRTGLLFSVCQVISSSPSTEVISSKDPNRVQTMSWTKMVYSISINVSICLWIEMIQLTRILDGRPLFSKCIEERFGHMRDYHHLLKRWRCFSRHNGGWVTAGNINHDLSFLMQCRQINCGFITKPISIANSIPTCNSTLRLKFKTITDRYS